MPFLMFWHVLPSWMFFVEKFHSRIKMLCTHAMMSVHLFFNMPYRIAQDAFCPVKVPLFKAMLETQRSSELAVEVIWGKSLFSHTLES